MRNASEEERIKAEIEKQERQAIISYDADSSANNTNMRVNHLTQVAGRISKLKRDLYECQHPSTY